MEQQKDITQKDVETKGHDIYGGVNNDPGFPRNMTEDKDGNNAEDKTGPILSKAEKLATATYMVTDLIPLTDPIRTKIKECVLDFLSDIHVANNALWSERAFLYRQVISVTDELCGLLGVASSVGFVSGMNYAILRSEYSNLKWLISSVDEVRGSVGSAFTLREEFFAGDKMIPAPPGQSDAMIPRAEEHKGQNTIKDNIDTRLSFMPKLKIGSSTEIQMVQRNIQSIQTKNKRREGILKILKKKKDVTIKDISETVPGCSEKTIQRELLSMVASGVLKKEGEKRWSRYSLN
ncbi:MAG: hypothetical protein WC835_03575 [Candidatus Paceibacterota bacterium]|jgi:hypothetical protein